MPMGESGGGRPVLPVGNSAGSRPRSVRSRRNRVEGGSGGIQNRRMNDEPHTKDNTPEGTARYRLVARAIEYLQQHAVEQPELDHVARAVGVSPAVLQRTFSAFAGISPKRFLQFLTKQHARRLLVGSSDVLAASLATGLSSPGRLHDLMVQADAMTPGEVRRLGAGVVLEHGFVDTPLGEALAARTSRGLAYFGFVDPADRQGRRAALDDLRARWPRATLRHDGATRDYVARAFARWRNGGSLHLLLAGTNLQIKVWEALLAVPEGRLVSYAALARGVGQPRAVRAVASAVGRNPLSVLIPCHRVIRASGDLGGYRWGLPRKAALIALESAHVAPGAALLDRVFQSGAAGPDAAGRVRAAAVGPGPIPA
jgi:AraC family transcriptional regulator of adaptative response/methylated-DNA-[protein]-cysteine methyltransferase